ncbi:MAG: glycosyltransferase [Acidobacteriota bacterium]
MTTAALAVSVIIPVRNGARRLERCLGALRRSEVAPRQIILVDDGSTDGSGEIGRRFGATVIETGRTAGPARARNLGARAAVGDLLLFLDADVYVHPDTIGRMLHRFERDAGLAAVFGAYDESPVETNFLSRYKNLTHCFVHRSGRAEASTFWTGCGAIRRQAFWDCGGFDESYTRPSIEDIELGSRLKRAGRRIALDPGVRATHGKRWTFWGLLRSDIFDRALPWTALILRDRHAPDDLDLRFSHRVSALLACLGGGAIAAGLSGVGWRAVAAGGLAWAAVAALNRSYYRFLARRAGALFALRAFPMRLLYYVYSLAAFLAGLAWYGPRLFRRRAR